MREILTRREVSDMFKIPIRTIDYFVTSGQIPFSRLGKRLVRFDKEKLLNWFEERHKVEYRHRKKGAESN